MNEMTLGYRVDRGAKLTTWEPFCRVLEEHRFCPPPAVSLPAAFLSILKAIFYLPIAFNGIFSNLAFIGRNSTMK